MKFDFWRPWVARVRERDDVARVKARIRHLHDSARVRERTRSLRDAWVLRGRQWVWRRDWMQPQTQDEARSLITELRCEDLKTDGLHQMIKGTLDISRLRASDIMVPRSDMNVIQIDASREDVIRSVKEHGHSRYPVIDDDRGAVEGILLAKDVLTRVEAAAEREFSIKDMMLPPHTLPENKKLSALLQDFRDKRSHMGIVINEYGEVAGLVTIEDVLEEIVGEIEDEHDRESETPKIRSVEGGHYHVHGIVSAKKFNDYFGVKLAVGGQETIGGVVLGKFGYLPAVEEQITFGGFTFTVRRVSGRRIQLLDVVRVPSKP